MSETRNQCERLRLILKENGLKQKDLAATMGVSTSYISMLLKNPYIRLSPSKATTLEKKYGYNVDWILHGNEPKMKSTDQTTITELRKILASQLDVLNDAQIESVWAFIKLLNH